jgi:hypothetical protein
MVVKQEALAAMLAVRANAPRREVARMEEEAHETTHTEEITEYEAAEDKTTRMPIRCCSNRRGCY